MLYIRPEHFRGVSFKLKFANIIIVNSNNDREMKEIPPCELQSIVKTFVLVVRKTIGEEYMSPHLAEFKALILIFGILHSLSRCSKFEYREDIHFKTQPRPVAKNVTPRLLAGN